MESSAAACMGRPGGQGGRRARQAGWGDDGFGLKDLSLKSLQTRTRWHRGAIGYVLQGRDASNHAPGMATEGEGIDGMPWATGEKQTGDEGAV